MCNDWPTYWSPTGSSSCNLQSCWRMRRWPGFHLRPPSSGVFTGWWRSWRISRIKNLHKWSDQIVLLMFVKDETIRVQGTGTRFIFPALFPPKESERERGGKNPTPRMVFLFVSQTLMVASPGSSRSSAPGPTSSRSTPPPRGTGFLPVNTPSMCPSSTTPTATCTGSSVWAAPRWGGGRRLCPMNESVCWGRQLLIGASGISHDHGGSRTFGFRLWKGDHVGGGAGMGGWIFLSPQSTSALTHIPSSQKAVRRWLPAGQPNPAGPGVWLPR